MLSTNVTKVSNTEKINMQRYYIRQLSRHLEIVDECDKRITESDHHKDYFRACRQEAATNYAETMVKLMEEVINNAKITEP